MSLDLNHDIWTYFVLYSAKWKFCIRLMKYWNVPCRKIKILVYIDKYEGWTCPSMFLDAKHDIWTYLVLNSVIWKYWGDPYREDEILAYMLTSLRNKKVGLVPWFKTWYVILFCFVFGKIQVSEWPLSR